MIVDFEIFQTLKAWTFHIEANKPVFIQKVEMGIDVHELDTMENGDNVLLADIQVYMETEDKYAFVDWIACAESYHDEKSRKEAIHFLLTHLNSILKRDLEDGDAEKFWELANIGEEKWKPKEKTNHKMEESSNNNETSHCKIIEKTEFHEKLMEEMKEKSPSFNKLLSKFGLELEGELIENPKNVDQKKEGE